LALSAPSDATAHARWFVDDKALPPAPPIQFDRYYAAMIASVPCFVIVAILVERKGARRDALDRLLHAPMRSRMLLEWRLLSIALGAMLVANSMTHVFMAPNLPAYAGGWCQLALFVQVVVGSMYIIQSRLIVAGLIVFSLPVLCWCPYSFGSAVDYAFELIGIGGALLLVAPELSTHDLALRNRIARD
jgi:hypothetical protein